MGALVVCGALIGAFAVCCVILDRGIRRLDQERNRRNARVARLHANAGNKWYPHEMADGSVRWYAVDRDYAVDL